MEGVDFNLLPKADKLDFILSRVPPFEKNVLSALVAEEDSTLTELLDDQCMPSATLKFMIAKLIATKGTDLCHAVWLNIFSALSTGN